ncbi:MAG: hypothetical protein ACFFD9_06640 [Candidatus Thorarchaeota archaeon]
MPVRFLTRLSKGEGHYLKFYVPRHVSEFYRLESGSYKGGVTLADGTSASYRIRLSRNRNTLRGRVPDCAGSPKTLVEIWIYRDTWIPFPRIEESAGKVASEWPMLGARHLNMPSGTQSAR